MRSRKNVAVAVIACAAMLLVGSSAAQAGIIWLNPFDATAAPPPTLGQYTMTPFGDDARPNGIDVGDVPSPLGGDVVFSQILGHTEVGAPGWATWSHGYTGDVYYTYDATDPNTVRLTLPYRTGAFYFYAEPNVFNIFSITAVANGGPVSLMQQIQGNSGAKYFGVYTDDFSPIYYIDITAQNTAGGFAVGEFGIAPVPEPGTLLLVGSGISALILRRRRKS